LCWELHNGPIPEGLVVRHRCDNPRCVNPAHLELGTQADNVRDREERGRRIAPRGAAHGRARLTVEQVVAIRESGATHLALAAQYGVSVSAIGKVRNRQTYQEVA